jgi:cytochrome b561
VAYGYLVLAMLVAATLTSASRLLRSAGTVLVAFGLAMIAASIVLANLDGTFASFAAKTTGLKGWTPTILNLQAGLAVVAVPFLIWAAWIQWQRRAVTTPGALNGTTGFGQISRLLHWATATLMLIMIPMGLFVSVLPAASVERPMFLAAHQSLGLTVLLLVALRLVWLLVSPAPPLPLALTDWERRLARVSHIGLYALILGFPLSGFLLTTAQGQGTDLFGWGLGPVIAPDVRIAQLASLLHNIVLPFVFYAVILAHVGAVLRHHFGDRRRDDVRRMLA